MPEYTTFSPEHRAACWLYHEMAPRHTAASGPNRRRPWVEQIRAALRVGCSWR
jgi:hypothetical protein